MSGSLMGFIMGSHYRDILHKAQVLRFALDEQLPGKYTTLMMDL